MFQKYLYDTLDVSMSFRVVQRPEFCCSLPPFGVGPENRSRTFTLCSNNTTHDQKSATKKCISLTLKTKQNKQIEKQLK